MEKVSRCLPAHHSMKAWVFTTKLKGLAAAAIGQPWQRLWEKPACLDVKFQAEMKGRRSPMVHNAIFRLDILWTLRAIPEQFRKMKRRYMDKLAAMIWLPFPRIHK